MKEEPLFSQRHGLESAYAPITVRYDAPLWLRNIIIRIAYDSGLNPSALRELLCNLLLETPNSNNWSDFPNIDNEVQGLLANTEWFRVYDFIELIVKSRGGVRNPVSQTFAEKLNDAFIRKGVGWQLKEGRVEIRGEESFEESMKTAIAVTGQTGRSVAEQELHEALLDLSKRPKPDVTGAIQHAIAALECVARDVTGNPNATLGDLVKRNPGLFPPPLDKGVEKIWGYASDQARHVREGKTLEIGNVELVVGITGNLVTYLVKKFAS